MHTLRRKINFVILSEEFTYQVQQDWKTEQGYPLSMYKM